MRLVVMVMALVVGLLASGCASLPETINAIAKDNASFCLDLDATVYGRARFCRTNTDGAALLGVKGDEVMIQHRGR